MAPKSKTNNKKDKTKKTLRPRNAVRKNGKRGKKEYKEFPVYQLTIMEKFFKTNQFPSKDEISGIFPNGEVPYQKVKNWFGAQRRRAPVVYLGELPSQMKILDDAYKVNKSPDIKELSERTGISSRSPKAHFARRRQVDKIDS
ncbi:hypothetical protein B9Z55_024148 [Caenorhabditis nigoni]|uniref:Homeobox domain-containing protein n=1 Tax=Caenorhabditis nigoni TaxID=1611254 RepID=A0A2G5SSZ3_9PELO|nr:hypothetical protein B9Z55_024148 [Caenorhabditis nigoni]